MKQNKKNQNEDVKGSNSILFFTENGHFIIWIEITY